MLCEHIRGIGVSFGIEVINESNQRVFDQNNPLYTVVPATVNKQYESWYEGHVHFQSSSVRITYSVPYKSSSPPLIFMKGGGWAGNWTDKWQYGWGHFWYNNIRYEHFGSPGNWTGVFIRVIVDSNPSIADWDMRKRFLVAGTSANLSANGDYGIKIFTADNKTVFDSNANFLEVIQHSNNWVYRGRTGHGNVPGGNLYEESWENTGVVVPTAANEWISLIPYSEYRRYNGEIATVWPVNVASGYHPWICMNTGRSGSNYHSPMMVVRTIRAAEYTYI